MTNKYTWLNEDSRTFLKRGYLKDGETPEERIVQIGLSAEKYLNIKGFADKFDDYMAKIDNMLQDDDINMNFLFKNVLWLGASYRSTDILVLMLEVNATRYLRIGYAYDYTFSDISIFTSGSHEIMLSVDFGKTIVKSTSPRYF